MHVLNKRSKEKRKEGDRGVGKDCSQPSGSKVFDSGAPLHIWLLLREVLGCTHSFRASFMCEYLTHTRVHENKYTHMVYLSFSLSLPYLMGTGHFPTHIVRYQFPNT